MLDRCVFAVDACARASRAAHHLAAPLPALLSPQATARPTTWPGRSIRRLGHGMGGRGNMGRWRGRCRLSSGG
eukprot:2991223-Alexandrium_andersonii.AAC.1